MPDLSLANSTARRRNRLRASSRGEIVQAHLVDDGFEELQPKETTIFVRPVIGTVYVHSAHWVLAPIFGRFHPVAMKKCMNMQFLPTNITRSRESKGQLRVQLLIQELCNAYIALEQL